MQSARVGLAEPLVFERCLVTISANQGKSEAVFFRSGCAVKPGYGSLKGGYPIPRDRNLNTTLFQIMGCNMRAAMHLADRSWKTPLHSKAER